MLPATWRIMDYYTLWYDVLYGITVFVDVLFKIALVMLFYKYYELRKIKQ